MNQTFNTFVIIIQYLHMVSLVRRIVFSFFLILSASLTADAQDIVGVWETIDDRTDLPTSYVEITQQGTKFFGHVVKMLRDDPNSLCIECSGKLKNTPIMNMTILRDMEQKGSYWTNGYILDPENGKEYKCNITMESKNKLILRGYIGAPLFGRSQDWLRVNTINN